MDCSLLVLPPEIWETIFKFACTDNGSTGRSLSLVSRQMNEMVKPYKLRSISVVGGTQIIKFSEFTAGGAGATQVATIQNLFIGITNPRLPLNLSRSGNHSTTRTCLDIQEELTTKAIHQILKQLSPTLLTLHLHFISPSNFTPFPPSHPMLQLSELTIYGPFLDTTRGLLSSSSQSQSSSSSTNLFPALKKLRMGNFQPSQQQGLPTDFIPKLAISLPRLTHLSIFQPLSTRHHVHSLGRLILSPGTFWSGHELKKLIIEVDVNSVLFEENNMTTTTNSDDDRSTTTTSSTQRELMLWLGKLRDCIHQTSDRRTRLIETHRSWVDVETAQIEWSRRNIGIRWSRSFQTRHSVLRSSSK